MFLQANNARRKRHKVRASLEGTNDEGPLAAFVLENE
jgi:hypothetical protein